MNMGRGDSMVEGKWKVRMRGYEKVYVGLGGTVPEVSCSLAQRSRASISGADTHVPFSF